MVASTADVRDVPRAWQGSPMGRDFGEFVARARVSMLGLVPSIARVRPCHAAQSMGCNRGAQM